MWRLYFPTEERWLDFHPQSATPEQACEIAGELKRVTGLALELWWRGSSVLVLEDESPAEAGPAHTLREEGATEE